MGAKHDALIERIEALEVEVAELRAAASTCDIQFVREVFAPKPVSHPIDFRALAAGVSADYACYDEAGDVYGNGGYL